MYKQELLRWDMNLAPWTPFPLWGVCPTAVAPWYIWCDWHCGKIFSRMSVYKCHSTCADRHCRCDRILPWDICGSRVPSLILMLTIFHKNGLYSITMRVACYNWLIKDSSSFFLHNRLACIRPSRCFNSSFRVAVSMTSPTKVRNACGLRYVSMTRILLN